MNRLCLTALLLALMGALINDVPGGPASGPQEAGMPATTADGDSATAQAEAMQREMEGMRRSLHEITILLAAALEQQELSIFMNRMELKQRRLQPLETALRNARKERQDLVDETSHLADMLEMFEKEAGNDPAGAGSLHGEIQRARNRLDRLAEREAALDLRIIELEDDLARNEEDIAILEEMVDERLGLR